MQLEVHVRRLQHTICCCSDEDVGMDSPAGHASEWPVLGACAAASIAAAAAAAVFIVWYLKW
jgi:hypothetical protein